MPISEVYNGLEINKVHCMDNRHGLMMLPEKCANLIISDPPYFEVKGDFDFVWKDFEEYLQFMEEQAILYKRILADNGTLFVYGHAKRIAYVQVIFDRYFNLENNLTWNKAERDGLFGQTGSEVIRSFPPCTERILMYSQDQLNLSECVFLIRDYIRSEILKAKGKISLKEINSVLGTANNGGGVASACLSLEKTEPAMITKEMYQKLQTWCNPHMCKEYEDLRKEYEKKRRPFFNQFKLNEVLNFRFVPSEFGHDTVKPERLTRALILTCSRPDDLVVVPFAGSGTECAMAAKEGRRFIGFDIKEEYVTMGNKRLALQRMKQELF